MIFKDFETMLNAQEALNGKYTPNWRESVSIEQQLTAIHTELAEWFESAPRSGSVETNGIIGWKWWKKNLDDDVQNKKIEVIDVWHFMMSAWLMLDEKEKIISYVNDYEEKSFDEVSNLLAILSTHSIFNLYVFNKNLEMSIVYGLVLLSILMEESEMTWVDLENGYFLKHELNSKRVDSGYQEGNYQKIDSDGNEDNRTLNV